ncbi:MAG TPA: hypothetical protein PLL20_19835, partial [Phycisphaerae bacterium]|nr:hypothetical protein [Phycisphaerae bacterium]
SLGPESFPGHILARSAPNPFRAVPAAESFPPSPFIGHGCCAAKQPRRVDIPAPHTAEPHHDISDLAGQSAQTVLQYARSHWGIENKPHWSPDVTFLRNRIDHSAENFSRIRRLSLNLLRREKPSRAASKANAPGPACGRIT